MSNADRQSIQAHSESFLDEIAWPRTPYSRSATGISERTELLSDYGKNFPFPAPTNSAFTFIDLFAGIGGFRQALQSLGGRCLFSSEWDKDARKTYFANYGEVPHGDITLPETKQAVPIEFDVLCAGFPCQAFSIAGKRGGFNDTRGTLFFDVAEILRTRRPKIAFLENVKGLVSHDKGRTFETILETLRELNYAPFFKVLNATDFGLPQERKRIYIVALNKDFFDKDAVFEFPECVGEKANIADIIEENAVGYSVSKHLQSVYIYKKNDGKPQVVDKTTKGPARTLVSTYHKIQRLTSSFVRDGETGLRLFTTNECKALMGFDKAFVVPVSRTQMYRQFGNSVAVPVVKAIGKKLVEKLEAHV
jgi:DNA (cytosine-5)-methyltransferase 1